MATLDLASHLDQLKQSIESIRKDYEKRGQYDQWKHLVQITVTTMIHQHRVPPVASSNDTLPVHNTPINSGLVEPRSTALDAANNDAGDIGRGVKRKRRQSLPSPSTAVRQRSLRSSSKQSAATEGGVGTGDEAMQEKIPFHGEVGTWDLPPKVTSS